MINHVRTLLLNRGADGTNSEYRGEEFVPTGFRPRRLAGDLRLIYESLFGTDPDRAFINFRLQQLLTLLHNSKLEYALTASDARITYWPFDATEFFAQIVAVQPIGHHEDLPFITGTFTPDSGRGRAVATWRVHVETDSRLAVVKQTPRTESFTIVYASRGGLSELLTLPDSAITFRVRADMVGKSWLVEAVGQPQDDVAELLKRILALVGDGVVDNMIRQTGNAELVRVWLHATDDLTRYAAFLLAYTVAVEGAPLR